MLDKKPAFGKLNNVDPSIKEYVKAIDFNAKTSPNKDINFEDENKIVNTNRRNTNPNQFDVQVASKFAFVNKN